MNLWRRWFSWKVLSAAVMLGVTSGLILAGSNLALGETDEGFFPKAKLSRPIHQVRVVTNIMIPMRDGTQLAADIYMPSGKGPFPALVERTPYGKSGGEEDGRYFARRGFAVVVQDVRGRFASEGDYYFLRDEAWGERQDGYDTVEWIAVQPWSSGSVGSYGTSYGGMNSYLTAVTRPPHLKAVFSSMAFRDLYREQKYPNGAMRGFALNWMVNYGTILRPLTTSADFQAWLKSQTGSATSFYRSLLSQEALDTFDHPSDGPFWHQWAIYKKWSEIDVPIYHHNGWYDRFTEGATGNFAGIVKSGKSEKTRNSQKLIIGPWPHGSSGPREVGDIDFGPEAEVEVNAVRLRWFEYWLKEIDNGIMEEPPVSIFVMGENKWRHENSWPIARTRHVPYYFRSGSHPPQFSLNDGVLSSQQPGGAEKPDEYVSDPLNPLPTVGGEANPDGPSGPQDQRPVEARSLTFTSEPLLEDLEVTGQVQVVLYASSSAVDTDFVAMLSDVHPDGYSLYLRQQVLRARYRESLDKPVLMEPDEIYKFTFQLLPTSNVFKAGHRIRVSISSSSFPKWIPNTNSGKQLGEDTKLVQATNVIYHDSAHPSHVVLPLISP